MPDSATKKQIAKETNPKKDEFELKLDETLQKTALGEMREERKRFSVEVRKLVLEDRERLLKLAMFDPLTKAYNRGYFEDAITKLVSREKRNAQDAKPVEPFSVLMIDLDHFKAVNDRYGHPIGDDVLREVVGIMKETLKRGTDVVARYGGEEFIVILENTDGGAALHVAENIRQAIERETLKLSESKKFPKVTASIGCATYSPNDDSLSSAKQLVSSADLAAFSSKNQGRNRVTGYSNKIRGLKEEPSALSSIERLLPGDPKSKIDLLEELLGRAKREAEIKTGTDN
jgi:diguanylate cyclase (GGDEF)-like protein